MKRRLVSLSAGVAGMALLLAACGGTSDSGSGATTTAATSATSAAASSAAGGGASSSSAAGSTTAAGGSTGGSQCGVDPVQQDGKVAVILQATAASGRWESQDKPRLLNNIKTFAPNAEVIYSNGEGVAANQLSQAEAAISSGAKVLLVAPVDGVAAGEIARRAADAGVKFIAYDAPVQNAPVDYYVSFDNNKVGALMGEYVKDNTKDGDTVAFISGAPQDDNAARFQQGAMDVLQPLFDNGTRKLGYQAFTPNWDLNNAQRQMEQALSELNDNVQAVVAANDNLATGSINALQASGLAGKIPVTGQDATATGLGQIVTGTQGMTVYKPIEGEAKAASQLVACLLADQAPPADLINGQVNNGAADVPSVLLEPIKVTKDNIADTVVKDNFVSWDDICQGVSVQCPPQ